MTILVDAPARVDDVQLLGSMVGSGYRTPPALVRRGDGQTLQLSPLLYLVLESIDGQRTCAEIADRVSRAMQRGISAEMVAGLVDEHLRTLGLVRLADGSDPPLKRSNPLLGLKLKFSVTNPRATHLLTDPFRFLFRPVADVDHGPRLPGRDLVGVLRAGPGPGRLRRLPAPPAAAAGVRGDRALRRVPRVRPRRGRPLQRRRTRRHGSRPLPGVARVLHRRHRQLPARTRRPDPHRPGRPVLQRPGRGAHLRLVVRHRVGRPAAAGRDPDPADGATAAAAAALRRLPPARRPGRGPRPLPPDPPHPARTAARTAGTTPTTGC